VISDSVRFQFRCGSEPGVGRIEYRSAPWDLQSVPCRSTVHIKKAGDKLKRALWWGFTGAASAVAALGLSSVAHAADLDSGAVQLPVPQAPGPEVPPAPQLPVPHAPGPEVPPAPQLPVPHAPGPEVPPAPQLPVPHAPGPEVPPKQPVHPVHPVHPDQPGRGEGSEHAGQSGRGPGSNPSNGESHGQGSDHSSHGKGA
jgi:hypothetical protein